MPAGRSPGFAAAAPSLTVAATGAPPPFFSSSASDSTYSTSTWSPTFICAKFFTSGPAVTTISLPFGPFSVTARVAASIAVIVAVALTVWAMAAAPGPLPATTAPVWAKTGDAANAAATRVDANIERSMGRLLESGPSREPAPAGRHDAAYGKPGIIALRGTPAGDAR